MYIDPSLQDGVSNYKLLTGVIVPRPIAWVGTETEDSIYNLAPFSAFTMISYDPPMIGISMGLREGSEKDTLTNIRRSGEFVVNCASWEMRDHVHESAIAHSAEISEADLLGLTTVPSISIKTPRLKSSKIAMECVVHKILSFGRAGSHFVTATVQRFFVEDDLITDGKISPVDAEPLCRLAGPNYARLGDVASMIPIKNMI